MLIFVTKEDFYAMRKIQKFFQNCAYSIFSNFISLVISIGFVFIVPKFIGVEAYGYWQLYLFYLSYTIFFHFGWFEGIYLKYGGSALAVLNVNSFRAQFWILNTLTVFLSVFLFVFLLCFVEDIGRREVGYFVTANLLLFLPKTFLAYILLSVGCIQAHSILILTARLVSIVGIILLFIIGYRQYQALIFADIAGKFIELGIAVYFCRNFAWGKFVIAREIWWEIWEHVVAGSKVMFANIAGMLMLGILRFAIEQHWGIVVFGKVSMALSAANLFLVFTGAMNIVLFPLLRRTSTANLARVYKGLRLLLSSGALGMLFLYYPVSALVKLWLPLYRESCLYLAVLFPICIYEIKWIMLLCPYLKALRKEKTVLLINLIVLVSSFVLTGITVLWLERLDLAVFSITVLIAWRCFLAEFFLARILDICNSHSFLQEVCGSALFIYTAGTLPLEYGTPIYAFAYLVYLIMKYRMIRREWNVIASWISRV